MLLFVSFSIYAEDGRNGPVDLYLLIDTSFSLSNHYSEVVSWIRSTIFEELLQQGDSITIVAAGESVQVLSEISITGQESFQELEKLLQSIRLQDTYVNWAGAIREIKRRDSMKFNQQSLGVALMITGTDSRGPVSNGEKTGNWEGLLKYSKVEDFPGWKVLVIGLNVDGKIKVAAAEYQAFLYSLQQKTP